MNIFTACQQGNKPAAPEEKTLPQQTFMNVPYGKDPRQVLDVYLPASRLANRTKSLILIHGGGWNQGSKEEFTAYIDSFKKEMPDFAIFNINYRLVSSGFVFPAQENDVKAAVDFITANAEKYSVDKNRFALLGVSAGAHLALLQAYKYSSPAINAVVDYFGPTDLLSMFQKPWHPLVPMALQMVTGTSPQQNVALYKNSSPINFVNSTSPPTLLLHGGQDVVVHPSQSKALAQRLADAGVPHQLKIFASEGHGRWYGVASKTAFTEINDFLKTHLP